MKLELISSNCSSGPCPAVFKTDKNSFVVQGRLVPPDVLEQLVLAQDETAVEIPSEIVEGLLAKLGR